MHASEVQRVWRLLIDPPLEGPQNMAIDEALLERCASEKSPLLFPTVRFYRWSCPTLSLGYNQDIESSLHVHECKARGIPIVRRPTGGKAVLHDQEITYSVIASFSSSPFRRSVFDNYRLISEAVIKCLKFLGIRAVIADEEAPSYSRAGPEACFARLSRFEISYKNFKMVGSAQRRKRRAFLQHGSLLLDANRTLLKNLIQSKNSVRKMNFITIKEALGKAIPFEEIASLMVEGFEKKFGVKLRRSALTREEKELAESIARKRMLL